MQRRASNYRPMFAIVLFCAILLFSGCQSSTLHGPAGQYDQGAIIRGDTATTHIALIFTGGEYGEGTEFILDTLKSQGIPAAFFVTNDYIEQPQHHPLLRRMLAEGHYLGPHSHSHPLYCSWDDRSETLVTENFFRHDLNLNITALRRFGALPPKQTIYFIPPYEWYNADQVRWAREMGVVLFNFTPGSGSNRDWIPESQPKFVSSETILRDILSYETRDPLGLNGFLLLLHLGSQRGDKMHPQLPALINELHDCGYTFIRADQLLAGLSRN